jgi:hypothetical protein
LGPEGISAWRFLQDHLEDNQQYLAGLATGDGPARREGRRVALVGSKHESRRATDFLRRVETRVTKALETGDPLLVRFGEEFDFATDQTFVRLERGTFDDALTLQTGNIIGQIRERGPDGRAVRVTSRFGHAFLLHMIASSEGFLELPELGALSDGGDNEWLLVYLWKLRLNRAFAAGIPKIYVNRRGRLPSVRGSVDVSDLLRVPLDIGRYLCRYREHAFDNGGVPHDVEKRSALFRDRDRGHTVAEM